MLAILPACSGGTGGESSREIPQIGARVMLHVKVDNDFLLVVGAKLSRVLTKLRCFEGPVRGHFGRWRVPS